MNISSINMIEIIQLVIILAVSIGLHEYAHAYTSNYFGDPTPRLQGRLTPNPLKHLDPIGFLMIFLIHFGRGKPVQINPAYYKHPMRDELFVALAGPATNLILAIFGILCVLIYTKITGLGIAAVSFNNPDLLLSFWLSFSFINISLAVFNLLPIPPLDGFRLVKMFFWKRSQYIEQYSMYISIFFLILLVGPGSVVVSTFLSGVSAFIFKILFVVFGQVFY